MNINDVGLKVLSWIKNISGNSVNVNNLSTESSKEISHDIWNELLIQYVNETGEVNYKGFISAKNSLDEYLDLLSNNPPNQDVSNEVQLAYWINAYNAFTIKLIIDNYPLKSIKDIADGIAMINSPWDLKFFEIGGVPFDLGTIEHEILRKKFSEPRIHFAINCASYSCPKLLSQAYVASQLEEQLEMQTASFINNHNKNIISDKELVLSKIFSWFEVDFDDVGGVKNFIKRYIKSDITDQPINYMEYNWNLNE